MSEEVNVSVGGDQPSSSSNEDPQPLSPMQKRVKALKKLTARLEEIDAQQLQEMHRLEVNFDILRQEIFEKRSLILSGEYEPTEEECSYSSDDPNELEHRDFPRCDAKTRVPNFWLTVLKNSKKVSENIYDHDEPILAHLMDIKVRLQDNPIGFILEFYFSRNEYFTNKVLTKQYEKNTQPSNELISLEVPQIRASKGCKINWKEGKNVTLNIKKTITPISKTKVKTVTEMIQQESFFSFFTLPVIPSHLMREKLGKHNLRLITEDSSLGLHFKKLIIPKAVTYYNFATKKSHGFGEDGEVYDSSDSEEESLTCNIL